MWDKSFQKITDYLNKRGGTFIFLPNEMDCSGKVGELLKTEETPPQLRESCENFDPLQDC